MTGGPCWVRRARSPEDAQGFASILVPPGRSRRVAARGHQLMGVVVDGRAALSAGGPDVVVTTGEMFVSNGFDLTIGDDAGAGARVDLVSLPAQRP